MSCEHTEELDIGFLQIDRFGAVESSDSPRVSINFDISPDDDSVFVRSDIEIDETGTYGECELVLESPEAVLALERAFGELSQWMDQEEV